MTRLIHLELFTDFFTKIGHSQPMHSVPVPINVRCYSNSDVIVRRSEVTQRANSRSPFSFCDDFVCEHDKFDKRRCRQLRAKGDAKSPTREFALPLEFRNLLARLRRPQSTKARVSRYPFLINRDARAGAVWLQESIFQVAA
jgi:hypothetical protein